MRYRTWLAIIAICSAAAYFAGRHSNSDKTETVRYQDRVIRQIVRVTNPDGSSKEIIHEVENKKGSKKTTTAQRKYFVGVSYAPWETDGYQVDVGYRAFKNVAVKASGVRLGGETTVMVGVQVDF